MNRKQIRLQKFDPSRNSVLFRIAFCHLQCVRTDIAGRHLRLRRFGRAMRVVGLETQILRDLRQSLNERPSVHPTEHVETVGSRAARVADSVALLCVMLEESESVRAAVNRTGDVLPGPILSLSERRRERRENGVPVTLSRSLDGVNVVTRHGCVSFE